MTTVRISAPDDRPAEAAPAAEDRRPADHRGRDRRQDVRVGQRDAGDVGQAGEEEPGDRREQRRDDVQDDQDLPRPGARQARRDRVVADRVEQPAVAGPPQAEQDQRGQRDEHERGCTGRPPRSSSDPSERNAGGTPGAGLDHLELPDVGQPEHDQAHAQGHDQRVDPEDADADAGHEARPGRPRPGRRRSPPAPGAGRERASRRRSPAIEATRRPTGRCRRSASSASGSRRGSPAAPPRGG